ncbi:hypothetical protein M758_1G210100 [Ceratodon purpureus]|uniref:Uncharacterized protein n=1 Tax=Ceratodon purpureus TaxID=3225 RepID=A0A8T0J8T4_CERPU|nr:hypothetical protein KC19_1G211600 [Ceratodon purpureus]KAG0630873.1 hypothetical protein M758_1G210100 [Ceratodon purpureus]
MAEVSAFCSRKTHLTCSNSISIDVLIIPKGIPNRTKEYFRALQTCLNASMFTTERLPGFKLQGLANPELSECTDCKFNTNVFQCAIEAVEHVSLCRSTS